MRGIGRTALGWTLGTTTILLILLVTSLLRHPHFDLWPSGKAWLFYSFADATEGGQSRVLSLLEEQGALRASLVYDSNLKIRYGGIGFRPSSGQLQDVSDADSVRLRYRTRASAPLRLQLRLDLAGHTRPGVTLTERCLLAELPPSPEWSTITLPIANFRTPGWWYQANHLAPSFPDRVDFSRFLGLNILDSELTPGIELRSLSLEGSWAPSLWITGLLPLPWLGLLAWRARRAAAAKTAEPVRPFGYPLETSPQEEQDFQRITQLIAASYSDPELSLAVIRHGTGIPEAKISTILEKRTQLRFKPYLNQVRIEEASRLLRESDQSITEIAYLVGYGNTTHFNRVFRGLKKLSPTEYRRTTDPTNTVLEKCPEKP